MKQNESSMSGFYFPSDLWSQVMRGAASNDIHYVAGTGIPTTDDVVRLFLQRLTEKVGMHYLGQTEQPEDSSIAYALADFYQHPKTKEYVVLSWNQRPVGLTVHVKSPTSEVALAIQKLLPICQLGYKDYSASKV